MTDTKKRILLVDDEPAVLLTYRMILEKQGYAVVGVPSARAAADALLQQRFDLLLSDLALEEVDSGLKLLESARQEHPDMACILLTGYLSSGIVEEAERRGITLLLKPTETSELLETVALKLRSAYEHQDPQPARP